MLRITIVIVLIAYMPPKSFSWSKQSFESRKLPRIVAKRFQNDRVRSLQGRFSIVDSISKRMPRSSGKKRAWIKKKLGIEKRPIVEDQFASDSEDWKLVNMTLPAWATSNDEERNGLAAMKFIVGPRLEEIRNKSNVVDRFPDVYGETRMLRFLLKDSSHDPVSSAQRYIDFLNWRQENKIDEIRSRVEDAPFQLLSKIASDCTPCDFNPPTGRDVIMHPVILFAGDWKTAELATMVRRNELTLDDFIDHWVYLYESLQRHLYLESSRLNCMVYVDEVCDLSNMNIGQFSPAFIGTVLKPFVHVTQAYYPQTLNRISFLNPPSIFELAWNIVKRLVSPGTVDKVRLFSGFNGSAYEFVQSQYDCYTARQ